MVSKSPANFLVSNTAPSTARAIPPPVATSEPNDVPRAGIVVDTASVIAGLSIPCTALERFPNTVSPVKNLVMVSTSGINLSPIAKTAIA